MVTLRVIALAVLVVSVYGAVSFNDMTPTDPAFTKVGSNPGWTKVGTCWDNGAAGTAVFTGGAGCQGLSFNGASTLLYAPEPINSVSSGSPVTTAYACFKVNYASALTLAPDAFTVGSKTGPTALATAAIGTSGTVVLGAQFALQNPTTTPGISLSSPIANAGITRTLQEFRLHPLLTTQTAFTSPTYVAGGTSTAVTGFQFNGGQTPVSDSISSTSVTGAFTPATGGTTTPITYGFTPKAPWAATDDTTSFTVTFTDTSVYKPPSGGICSLGQQTLTATVVVNVVMITGFTGSGSDIFATEGVIVEKISTSTKLTVVATSSTNTNGCSWTDSTPPGVPTQANTASYTLASPTGNGGTLTVTCPGTGGGSGVTYVGNYPVKIVQMGTVSVVSGGGYSSTGTKVVTGSGVNPKIQVLSSLDTNQVTFSGTGFMAPVISSTAPFQATPTLTSANNGATITLTAQYKGPKGSVSTITDTLTLNIIYLSYTTFGAGASSPNSQQSTNCPMVYQPNCIVASASSPTVAFNTVGTGFDTQVITVNSVPGTSATGAASGLAQSVTFTVAQDQKVIFSTVSNSAVTGFTINSNDAASSAAIKQYNLAFITVSAGTAGLQVSSTNTNAGKTCVMSPTTTTCTFKVGGTAFNTVDVVETGGSSLAKTGITASSGSTIVSNTGAASDDGSTVSIKAYINGVSGYSETSAQTISIYYLSVTAFQTQVTPAAVVNAGTNYVYFALNANSLGLKTLGTGFDTVVYSGFGGGVTVTDTTGTFTGSAPSRTASIGPKAQTVVLGDDGKQITLTVSNSQGGPTTYAVPSASFAITLVYTQVTTGTGTGNGIFATGAGASNAGNFPNANACIASAGANTCSYTVAGNSFNGYTFTASNPGTGVTGNVLGSAAPTIGASSVSFTTPALTIAEDGATLTATVFEAGSSGYTTRPTSTTSPSSLFYLSVSSFETNTVPASFAVKGTNYVVLNSATTLQLQTKGTGFNTVSYSAASGTLKTAQGKTAGTAGGTETAWMTGASPSRTADSGQLAITGLNPADNNAVVSTTVSNKAVSSSFVYLAPNALNIVYLSQTTYAVTAPAATAAPATAGNVCYTTPAPASACTFTLTGTGFDTFDYTSSAAGTTAKATAQAASIAGSPAVSTATWTPSLSYLDTTTNAAAPVTMQYTAYYKAQTPTPLTITGSLPVIFVSDFDFAAGKKYTPLTNSQATPNTLNLFAANDNTATSPNPVLSGKGTGFTNAKLQKAAAGGGMFADVPVPAYTACTVTNPGTNTATYSCPMIPAAQTGFLPADNQAQFQVVLWNSGNTGVTYTTAAITVTVFGFSVDPPVSLIGFTTVRANVPYSPPTTNTVSYTYTLVTSTGNNIPATQSWRTFGGDVVRDPQMPSTATPLAANQGITFIVSANGALSSTPNAPWTAGGPFVGQNADSYKITLTLSGVTTFRQTSFQLITFSYFSATSPAYPNANGDYLYDYYLGYTGPKAANPPNYVPPNPEPSYFITVKADHLAVLDKTGAIIMPITNQCTLTVTPGTAGLAGPTLSQVTNNQDNNFFNVDCTQSTDPSQPNCVYNQVEKLNQATLSVVCTGPPAYAPSYGPSVPLTIKYPAKMQLAPTQVWTSTQASSPVPNGFCIGYTGQYPEPGHWDYDQALTVNFNWAKLGNPAVTAIQSVMSWDVRTLSSSGTALTVAASGGFPGAPKVLNGANPIAYQISNGTPLTIAQARDIYFNNYLTVTAKFDGTGGTPLLSPFTITFQPLDVTKDNGILQPHFPPVLATTPVLLAPQYNNFPDVGGFVWQPPALGFIVKDGFPKHDSPFGNTKYSTTAIPVFPNRNYDQILETRVTVAFSQKFTATSPTTYDTKYQYFTSVAANLASAPGTVSFTEPKAGVVTGAYTNGVVGVYAATSTITPTGPLWTYNKWIYRWILGVYKVSGQYEPYIVPTAGVFDPTALTYKYHTASSGFEGIWNWYPREFTPSLCPSVPAGNPFDIGTVNAVVVPTTTASMYPTPDAGVLSWAYSHQTAGPSFRIDSNLASGILSGAQNANTALLPAVSTVIHTFNSQYTITKQQASPTTDAFGPQVTEDLGYTVTATGKISSIVSADANSIISARYSHTLPFYLLLAPDGKSTTSGQRTVVGYPTVVTVNNCKSITTLTSGTAYTVASHRAGETFVLSLSSVTAGGTLTVTVVDATPGTMDTPQTVISTTVTAGSSPVFRFTAGYNLAGVPLTTTSVKYSGVTATVQLSYHEFSSIPANWPFANDPTGAVIAGYANNEAVKTCVGQKVSASSVSGTTPAFGVPTTAQYFGCGTANQVTPPTC